MNSQKLPWTEQQLLEELSEFNFERHVHPAAFTSEQADEYTRHLPGQPTKNLFLRDKKKRNYFLVVVAGVKRVDLAQWSRERGLSRLSLGSSEDLLEKLGVTPGSVTVLSVINDPSHSVKLCVDRELMEHEWWHCHPLINTATLVIRRDDVLSFVESKGHTPEVVTLPIVKQ